MHLRAVSPLLVWCLLAYSTALPLKAASAQSELSKFLDKFELGQFFPGADRLGDAEGSPPSAPVFAGDQLIGYLFLNADVSNSIGYSGKPINVVVGLDLDGRITGAALVGHSEPIVLVGIPEHRVRDFVASYGGTDALQFAVPEVRDALPADIVSGATVTIMVIDDSIKRAAIKVARARGLGGLAAEAQAQAGPRRLIDMSVDETEDWVTLLGDGSVRRLSLSVGQVDQAFRDAGNEEAAARSESDVPDDPFIDLYVALATIPTIGHSLLGDAEYNLLLERLEPNQHAIIIAANGPYSFKGSGYVRGGIFDRIQLIQAENSARFRDRQYRQLLGIAARGAPGFDEIGLFIIPPEAEFDPTEPWRLQLLAQRAVGAIERAFTTFAVSYLPLDQYIKVEQPSPPVATAAIGQADEGPPLWQRIWQARLLDVAILAIAMVVLTLIFFFQDWLVRRPRLANGVRIGFLLFTVGWLGFYAQAQLSVVNVLTFANALLTDFRWDYFLTEPLIFILWFAVVTSLLFWGRGAYCGWMCPFGALQELLNKLARWVRIPQYAVPWGLHERIWPLKYMIFLGLLGLSLSSLALAEQLSEVEPFKTAIVLHFARDWPFVAYAVALLAAGLFIERFFCRYLCPLGAALAIPGRMRMFEWLRRYKQCGSPCQICAKECMVQAIHPNGQINPNECLYCMHCQIVYYDDHKCPVMVEKRQRRERRLAAQSPSMTTG